MDNVAIGFITAFLITPFGGIGYIYMIFLVFYEAFVAYAYTEPYSLSQRLFTITMSVIGRVLGEILWPFLLTMGAGDAL
jgi:hypothetical protein